MCCSFFFPLVCAICLSMSSFRPKSEGGTCITVLMISGSTARVTLSPVGEGRCFTAEIVIGDSTSVETIQRKRKQRMMMTGMECTHSSGRATRLGGAERSLMLICVKRRGPPTCWGRSMATRVALELRYSVIPMLASFIVPYKFLFLAPHALFLAPNFTETKKISHDH